MSINDKMHKENDYIFVVPMDFEIKEINPYTNKKYDSNWVYIEIADGREYSILDKTENNLFQVFISKNCSDWKWRLMDFISYELQYEKRIIIKVSEEDLKVAEMIYRNHSYKDNYLRDYEPTILIHSTTKTNYKNIVRTGMLKSWNELKENREIDETEPIGKLLGDHEEYKDYIMFSDGGVAGEIVVNSKNRNELIMDVESEYEPGARMYLDAKKIAESGLLIRDGLHYKVKDVLPLEEYLIWTATTENVLLDGEVCSPMKFANRADEEFRKR